MIRVTETHAPDHGRGRFATTNATVAKQAGGLDWWCKVNHATKMEEHDAYDFTTFKPSLGSSNGHPVNQRQLNSSLSSSLFRNLHFFLENLHCQELCEAHTFLWFEH